MPAISYRLLSYKPSDYGQGGVATYAFEHSTDGRAGTTLRFEVDLRILPEAAESEQRVEATLRFDGCTADSPVSSFDRLQGWLARAAEAVLMATSPENFDADYFEPPKVNDAGTLPVGGRIRLETISDSRNEPKPPLTREEILEATRNARACKETHEGGCTHAGLSFPAHLCNQADGDLHGPAHKCACGRTWSLS